MLLGDTIATELDLQRTFRRRLELGSRAWQPNRSERKQRFCAPAAPPAAGAGPALGHTLCARRVQPPFLRTQLPSVGSRCVEYIRIRQPKERRQTDMKNLSSKSLIAVVLLASTMSLGCTWSRKKGFVWNKLPTLSEWKPLDLSEDRRRGLNRSIEQGTWPGRMPW
jgi:hypothetical protein